MAWVDGPQKQSLNHKSIVAFGCSTTAAKIKRAGSVGGAPGPRHFNKEQTPPGDLIDPSPRFHGGCFGVYGHTSHEALQL
jgi:hypothetical protein